MSRYEDRRSPPPACQCVKWSNYNPCQMGLTQEDFLCDICRAGCGLLTISGEQGRHIHIVPLKIEELSRMYYG